MKMDVSQLELQALLDRQLGFFCAPRSVQPFLAPALSRAERCFSHVNNKYFRTADGDAAFSPMHGSQYCMFLYYLSREAHLAGDSALADRLYALNRMLHSVDMYYEVELPDVFFVDHPLGTVLGRARYANRLNLAQNVTVGNNHGIYPVFEENVTIDTGAAVLGSSHVGRNVEIAAGAIVCDDDIPSNCLVFGRSPHLIVKQYSFDEMKQRLYLFDYDGITE